MPRSRAARSPRPSATPPVVARRPGGFTIAETLVAATVSGIVLAGVLTASVELARSSVRLTHYAEMESQVRRALTQLEVDLKAASGITLNSASDLTVSIPRSDGTTSQYTYAWNSSTQILYRVPGASSSNPSGRVELVRGVAANPDGTPGVSFQRLDRFGRTATSDRTTKTVQVGLTVRRSPGTSTRTSSSVSATFTLRNKLSS
ncbi:MAG: hypothetical protein HZC55_16820 [Verrucomicrobia bacterium]|nr:hypothetical protein [Verrucomicrobiota bacterium]